LLLLDIKSQRGGIRTMNISLNTHLEELVKGKVESGLYNSVSEVIREALRLLEERDHLRDFRLEELRHEIQKGINSGEASPLNIEDIKLRGRKRLASQKMEG
jgi:antitoxin ParD1/3/4